MACTWAWLIFRAGILLPVALGTGCLAGDRRETVVDLIAELPFAEVRCEPTTIDCGSLQGRDHLIRGWYADERAGRGGQSFVWSRGDRSVVDFHLGRRRPLSVSMTVWPFSAPRLPDQALRVLLNDHEVARLQLRRGRQVVTFELLTDAQIEGANQLVFIPDHVWVPAEVHQGSDDRRQLAVAFDTIRFEGTEESTGVSVGTDQTLSIPASCRVDWYLEPPVGSALMADGVEFQRAGELGLEINLRRDGEATSRLASIRHTQGPLRLELTRHGGPVGLRFEVVAGESVVGPARRAVVKRPRLMAARSGAASTPPPVGAADAGRTSRPNIVLYLVDALRADHLGCYGSRLGVSPRIDEFAAEATVFEDAVAQSSWTKAAVASIFTGVWPPTHGVHGPHDRLPDDLPTMPELLRDAGYHTAAVVANAYVGRSFGFDRGFEHFEFLTHTVGDSSVIHARLVQLLDQLPAAEPFFLYVHTVDPHAPYSPPDEFRHRHAAEVREPEVGQVSTVRGLARGELSASPPMTVDLRALYAAEVAFNDFNFGRLVRELRQRGQFDESLIIVVSDHGEAFGEHESWTHGLDLHDEALRIPLVVHFPGSLNRGVRVRHTVQQADLTPTVLRAAGVVPPKGLDGADLLAFADRPRDRELYCYLDYWGRRGAAVLLGEWKLIRPLSEEFGSGTQLYDRRSDPGESANLAADLPVRSGYLDALLRRKLARGRGSIGVEIDAGTRSELEALGYIE
jgi:choline-sulfatase